MFARWVQGFWSPDVTALPCDLAETLLGMREEWESARRSGAEG